MLEFIINNLEKMCLFLLCVMVVVTLYCLVILVPYSVYLNKMCLDAGYPYYDIAPPFSGYCLKKEEGGVVVVVSLENIKE